MEIDHTPLADFRKKARQEALVAAKNYHQLLGEPLPAIEFDQLLVAGHQPELFHAGVWIKNFALNKIARENQLVPLNLIVDTDLVKSTVLAVPEAIAGGYKSVAVPFDEARSGRIYEGSHICKPELFRQVPHEVDKILGPKADRLLNRYWARETTDLTTALTAPRRQAERDWGCHNWELPISQLSQTPSFLKFVRYLLNDLENFRSIYNQVVLDYRRKYKLRSENHPVPLLGQKGAALETPFWCIDPKANNRQSYFHSPESSVDPKYLRSKALITTLYARVFLGAGFIHGIGGGKYDEVTDALIERWLGIEAPGYGVVSATVHLPLDWQKIEGDRIQNIGRQIRDLTWNPQRHLAEDGRTQKKQELIAAEPTGKAERRKWFRELQEITGELRQPLLGEIEKKNPSEARWNINWPFRKWL